MNAYLEQNELWILANQKYDSTHMIIFILFFVGIFVGFLLLNSVYKIFKCCKKSCQNLGKMLNLDDIDSISYNYYDEVSLATLKKEHVAAKKELELMENA